LSTGAPGKILELFETLDARGWEAPEPMMRVLELLERLPRGKKIVMLLHREPRPLFRILGNNGYHYRCRFVPDGYFEIVIWHAADTGVASASLD
jgi:tRNA 2-thiouridine synthesizing protein A